MKFCIVYYATVDADDEQHASEIADALAKKLAEWDQVLSVAVDDPEREEDDDVSTPRA